MHSMMYEVSSLPTRRRPPHVLSRHTIYLAIGTSPRRYLCGDGLSGKRVDLDLTLYGIPGVGVLLIYHKYGGGYQDEYTSKGDMSRLQEWVRNLHQTPLPVGLFIPFPKAYEAVKEFIETDGQLPKCIEWVANKDLPPGTFPDP